VITGHGANYDSPASVSDTPPYCAHDLTNVLVDRAPYAIAVILAVAFLLLLVVFRSVVIATFSFLMNLLTVGAAFGFAPWCSNTATGRR
jgi:uncharacterized membrane protein YdfJ with MMPL/SSD domain